MLKNQKVLFGIVGLAVIIIMSTGIVSADGAFFDRGHRKCSFVNENSNFVFHKNFSETGMEGFSNLFLNASKEEIRNAVKERMETEQKEWLSRVKEKLNLPQDSTEEEVRAALEQWREENKDLLRMPGKGGRGRFGIYGKRSLAE